MERVYAAFNLNDPTVFPMAQTFPTFGKLINVILRNAFMIAALIMFVFLVIGGLGVIMGAGGGDTKQLEKGRKTITGAVAGLLIIITSVWLIQIVEKLTGLSLLDPGL
jgi:hypothetical protein